MNHETELKLQAWADGELPPAEASRVAMLAEADPAAAALLQELRLTKALLAGNEPHRTLPEGREFFWTKIEREITAAPHPRRDTPPLPWVRGWLKYFAPAAIVAALALVLVTPTRTPGPVAGKGGLIEVDNPLDEVGSSTFRFDTEDMTVVWVHTF